jgi:hypothetical protein
MKKEKKIPTIFGLLLLVAAVFGGVILNNRNVNPVSKASGSCEPINPQITNITYNSANISFTTSSDCLSNISLDSKTYNDIKSKSKIHYFEITGMKENSPYQFTIISDGQNFNSDSFHFQTAVKPSKSIPSSNLAWGRVYVSQDNPVSDAIVYLTIPGSYPLSALVTSSGNWNISLSTSFNESLTDWFTPPNNIEENLVVISPGYDQTQIVSNTSRNNPVPDIILGQNNFSSPDSILDENTNTESLIDNQTDLSVDKQLTISNPSDGEAISNKKPDFFGTASPNIKLTVKVESPVVYNGSVTVNDDGSWDWSPPQDLTPGEHTITVTTEDNKTISRKFVVLAAENQPAFSASSSATTVTPTSTPTKTITPTITKTITSIPTPTLKITDTPTSIPTKIKSSTPSTASGMPRTGNTLPTFFLIFLSVGFMSFALLYHKKSSF